MTAASVTPAGTRRPTFYLWMAGVCALIAFGGFAPTYWLQIPPATFVGPPLLHLHALLFSSWIVLFVGQTWLAATGQLPRHRAWGVAGVSLATAMVFTGVAAAIYSLDVSLSAGDGDAARAFLTVPLGAIVCFAGFFTAALFNVTRPERHKRLMLLATLSLLQAAVGRFGFFFASGGFHPGSRPGLLPPPPDAIPMGAGVVVVLLVVAAMIYDWRTRGRPHPVYLIGGAVLVALEVLFVPLGHTAPWLAFASWAGGFAK